MKFVVGINSASNCDPHSIQYALTGLWARLRSCPSISLRNIQHSEVVVSLDATGYVHILQAFFDGNARLLTKRR